MDNQAATDPSSLPHPTSHDIDTSVIAGDESAELQITKSESTTPLQLPIVDELDCSAPTTSADFMSTSELSSSKEGDSTNVDTTLAVEGTPLPNPDESNGEGCKDEVAVATHDGDTMTEEVLESESTSSAIEKREKGDDLTPAAATTTGAGDSTSESSLPKEEESSIANTTTTIIEAEVPTSTTTLPETIESIPDESSGNGEEVVTPLVDDDDTTLKQEALTATDGATTDTNNNPAEDETSESDPVASSAEDDGAVLSSDNTKKRDAEELTADSTDTNPNEDGSGGKRQCVEAMLEIE